MREPPKHLSETRSSPHRQGRGPLAVLALLCLIGSVEASIHVRQASAATDCQPLCSVRCVKPLAICDRWDDVTPILGYPTWRENGAYDQESYADLNGNLIRDPAEPFVDGNANGVFDQEFYDPYSTGYLAMSDVGLTVHSQETSLVPLSYPSDLAGLSSIDAYRWNLENCNSTLFSIGDAIQLQTALVLGPTATILRQLISLDPAAVWNESCGCIENSAYIDGPRLLVLPLADPRIPLVPGSAVIHVVKFGAFFLETLGGDGTVTLRFCLSDQSDGEPCSGGMDAGFVRYCDDVSQVSDLTWGKLKAVYR